MIAGYAQLGQEWGLSAQTTKIIEGDETVLKLDCADGRKTLEIQLKSPPCILTCGEFYGM